MKMRKGFKVTWSDGTEWMGDCHKWAAQARKVGHKVSVIMIMGKRWPCGECEEHMH